MQQIIAIFNSSVYILLMISYNLYSVVLKDIKCDIHHCVNVSFITQSDVDADVFSLNLSNAHM